MNKEKQRIAIADLVRLKRSLETNDWPNIEPTLHELKLPGWYAK